MQQTYTCIKCTHVWWVWCVLKRSSYWNQGKFWEKISKSVMKPCSWFHIAVLLLPAYSLIPPWSVLTPVLLHLSHKTQWGLQAEIKYMLQITHQYQWASPAAQSKFLVLVFYLFLKCLIQSTLFFHSLKRLKYNVLLWVQYEFIDVKVRFSKRRLIINIKTQKC